MKRSTVCRTVFPDILPQLGSIIRTVFQPVSRNRRLFFQQFYRRLPVFRADLHRDYRWVMPLLALHILITVLRSMLRVRNPKETWGYLLSPDLGKFSINHWECTVGRAKQLATSGSMLHRFKTQCALIGNDEGSGEFTISDKNITCPQWRRVNGGQTAATRRYRYHRRRRPALQAITEHLEYQQNTAQRISKSKPLPAVDFFCIHHCISVLDRHSTLYFQTGNPAGNSDILREFSAPSYWIYVLVSGHGKDRFELGNPGFFACSLNLAITATALQTRCTNRRFPFFSRFSCSTLLGLYLRDLDQVTDPAFLWRRRRSSCC